MDYKHASGKERSTKTHEDTPSNDALLAGFAR